MGVSGWLLLFPAVLNVLYMYNKLYSLSSRISSVMAELIFFFFCAKFLTADQI